jgi:hypothetical protein
LYGGTRLCQATTYGSDLRSLEVRKSKIMAEQVQSPIIAHE